MPSRWCSRSASAFAGTAALAAAALLPAAPGFAATVLDQRVTVEIRPDGTVREQEATRVRLDRPADVDAWAQYAVYLDDHRTLLAAEGAAIHPDGERQKVRRRHRDEVASPGDGVFHASARYHVLRFPGVRVGSVIELETSVEVAPHFPAGSVALLGDDPIERLRVEVRGAGAGWRWRIDGPADGLTAEEVPGGVVVTGAGLEPLDPPAASPGGAARYPVLRYAWGGDGTWAAVGRWYGELLAPLPRAAPTVRERARGVIGDDRRTTLEALTTLVQREVRYVAVEIGIGGYRPSPPAETLERRWGDCKDKVLLLIDLLAEAGIPAHPALVLAAEDERIDPGFPSPDQFNHVIVAVPADAVPAAEGDAVAGGWLFADPTQPSGGARWLAPAVQGQDALVVLPGGGELVRLPVLPEGEATELVVNVRIDPAGDAGGGAGLRVRGSLAQALLDHADGGAGRSEQALRSIFSALLPGADLGSVGLTPGDGPVPEVDLAAAAKVPRLLQGSGDRLSLLLPALRSAPEPRLLADRAEPLIAPAGSHATTWHVTLPPGCTAPEENELAVSNAAGGFRQTLTRRGEGGFTLERILELRHRWYGPDLLPALAELSLAEHRAHRRRVRFSCSAETSGLAAGP
jgi:hypothetical protein